MSIEDEGRHFGPRIFLYGALLACIAISACRSGLENPFRLRRNAADASAEALLLVMSNSLLYDPLSVEDLYGTRPDMHARLAETLGRVGDERALPLLERLLEDDRSDVRQSAAFALGLIGSPASAPPLVAATVDEDRETGRLAVEALTRIGEPFDRWSGPVLSLPREEMLPRLLPSLFRMPPEVVDRFVDLEASALADELSGWLVYAAARSGASRSVALLRNRTTDPNDWIRSWAARGLGRLGSAEDLERLRPLVMDSSAAVAIQALRAGFTLVADGRSAAPDSWEERIDALLEDPRTGVRTAAFEVVGGWLPNRRLEVKLEQSLDTGSVHERELALLAMARGGTGSAEIWALRFALSSEPILRSASAEAAAILGLDDALRVLLRDPVPLVRLSALRGLLSAQGTDDPSIAGGALRDRDVAVRAAALEWLGTSPVVPIEGILSAMRGADSRRFPSLAINGVLALEARYQEELERGAVVAALENLSRDPEYLVRRAAADALERLGRPRPAIGWIVTGMELGVYRGIAERSRAERFVVMETDRGRLTMRLECRQAPLTCSSFMHLVNQSFYDGLSFHRVIPDFIVQGGDPRGDGWGGPGYTLRDEPTRLRFDRGVIGMARADRHTAGSQFFITLSAQPHLEGEYTAFGMVVEGEELLDDLVEGDTIVSMEELRE